MTSNTLIGTVADDLLDSIVASPKHQRRLMSKTFWSRFGIRSRQQQLVEQVASALDERNIMITMPEGEFGSEQARDWIILSLITPPIENPDPEPRRAVAVERPDDDWFAHMAGRDFESEREVEYFFVTPLLEKLGYVEDDLVIGHRVQMFEGVRKVNKEADFVAFNGSGRADEDALVVIEIKRQGKRLTGDVVGQARAYAIWLTTPYYIATNGEEIQVWIYRGGLQPDVRMMRFDRTGLAEQWDELAGALFKQNVIDYKARLGKMFEQANAGS